jgi:hypothetical protein
MRRRAHVWAVAVLTIASLVSSCSGDGSTGTLFTIEISPEFVQGAVPGSATGVLVTITNEEPTLDPVSLSVVADGAEVSVRPTEIREGEVAEVTLVAPATTEEVPLDIVVTGRRGAVEVSATRSTVIRPFEDSERAYADTLLGVFTSWLEENRPDLGIGPDTEFTGSFVSPVLVVTHYLYLSDDWELGLSWHVMVPPDDWAEIYLRPRDQLRPTLAFRLTSRQAAFDDGNVDIVAVDPPAEVTR